MSSVANDELLEEAQFYVDFFEGTALSRIIGEDIKSNDLENLQFHLRDARSTAFELEYNPDFEEVQHA